MKPGDVQPSHRPQLVEGCREDGCLPPIPEIRIINVLIVLGTDWEGGKLPPGHPARVDP